MKLIKISCLLCATAVLIYLAVVNALYGQSISSERQGRITPVTSVAGSTPAAPTLLRISPADVYALMCERADDNKPWAEPTAIPVSKAKVEKPFNITVK